MKRDKIILLTVIGFFAIAFVISLLPAGVPKGTYAGNFSNNRDTIWFKGNTYKRTIYSNNGKLIHKAQGTFEYDNGDINIEKFLVNLNDIDAAYNYGEKDLSYFGLHPERRFLGSNIVIVDYDRNYFYKRVD